MTVAAWVPIKRVSERVPNKNFRALADGEPLLGHIMRTLERCTRIDARYLYCSDTSAATHMPASFEFVREEPRLNAAPIIEVMHAFATLVDADVYVLAHATAPFLRVESIEFALDKVLSSDHDSALAVVRQQAFLWQNGAPLNYDPREVPRTQDLSPIYAETTGLYVYERDVLVSGGRRIGERPFLMEVSALEAIDIDEPEDLLLAQMVLAGARALADAGPALPREAPS